MSNLLDTLRSQIKTAEESLAEHKRDYDKQCKLESEMAKEGEWSWSAAHLRGFYHGLIGETENRIMMLNHLYCLAVKEVKE